jgi:hypothetical protein
MASKKVKLPQISQSASLLGKRARKNVPDSEYRYEYRGLTPVKKTMRREEKEKSKSKSSKTSTSIKRNSFDEDSRKPTQQQQSPLIKYPNF